MDRHKVIHMVESDIDTWFDDILKDTSLQLVKHVVAPRPRKGIPLRYSLQKNGEAMYRLEDPDKKGVWIYYYDGDDNPRRLLVGKRRLGKIIRRFTNG